MEVTRLFVSILLLCQLSSKRAEFAAQLEPQTVPSLEPQTVTFRSSDAFLEMLGPEGSPRLNVSLELRTFQPSGLLVFHQLGSRGHVKLSLSEGSLGAEVVVGDTVPVYLHQYSRRLDDGDWHSVELCVERGEAVLSVGGARVVGRVGEIVTGSLYRVGGGLHGQQGFVGCLRSLLLDGEVRESEDWTSLSSEGGVEVGGCSLRDHCASRPCNGGRCQQDFSGFQCQCAGTGYSGAVCATSLHYRSCAQYLHFTGYTGLAHQVTLDLDGVGPLPPISVSCRLGHEGEVFTLIRHGNEEATKVDGFQERGSFQQVIYYQADAAAMEALVGRSTWCSQNLTYDCRGSRLMEGWQREGGWGWWETWGGLRADYWPGGGAGGCACGLRGDCANSSLLCNCDSGAPDSWLQDGGQITDRTALPVRALYFGDTGTPLDTREGSFRLGPLQCWGEEEAREVGVQEVLVRGRGHLASVSLEWRGGRAGEVLLHTQSQDSSGRLHLDEGGGVTYTWIRLGGPGGNITVRGVKLGDQRWHVVTIEHNVMEVLMAVDRQHVVTQPVTLSSSSVLEMGTSFSVRELKVGSVGYAV